MLTTESQRHRESDLNSLSGEVVDCAFRVHKILGPGLLESIYEDAFCYELEKKKINFDRQRILAVPYDGIVLNTKFRLDLVVENKMIVELKCVERLIPLHDAQLLTYLKVTGFKLGLLFNFNSPLIKDGIKRVVL